MINTNEDLKKYISISPNFIFEDFEIYIPKALRSYVKRYVGDMYKDLVEKATLSDQEKEAIDLLDTAVANFAFYLYTPYISISMDASGLFVVNNDKRSPITTNQMNDIRRELLRSGHEAMDELLELLEKNADVFIEWHNNYSTIYKDSLVHSTSEFNKWFDIHNSRQTFLSLKSSILNVEDKIVKTTFNSDFLKSIEGSVFAEKKLIKEYLQKAIVHGTIAKVYAEGIYTITPSSIVLKFDLLDYERKKSADYSDQMKNAVESHTADMNNYLKEAVRLAETLEGALIEKQNNGYKPIITNSIIGI